MFGEGGTQGFESIFRPAHGLEDVAGDVELGGRGLLAGGIALDPEVVTVLAVLGVAELAEARQRMYGNRRVDGPNHSSCCTIWGDDGTGNAEGFHKVGDPGRGLPCNCGALENWQAHLRGMVVAELSTMTARAERAEADAAEMREALAKLKRTHFECEDSWYSCPKSDEGCSRDGATGCYCGADETNEIIAAALASGSGERVGLPKDSP